MKRAVLALVAGALVIGSPAQADTHRDTLVLVVDASASMAGDNLTAVKKAVSGIVDSTSTTTRIGLVTFNSKKVETLEPVLDHQVIVNALSAMKPSGGTARYDGITTALEGLTSPENARLVVVTDGYDTSSTRTVDQVRASLTTSGVIVDIVTVAAPDRNLKTMKRFTDAAGGRVFQAADAKELQGVLLRAIDQAMPTLTPTPSPSASASASESNSPSPSATEVVVEPGAHSKYRSVPVDVLITFVASGSALLITYWLLGQLSALRRRRTMALVLDQYSPQSDDKAKSSRDEESTFIEVPGRKRKQPARTTAAVLYSRAFPVLAERLTRADLAMKPEHFVWACTGVAAFFAVTFQVITGSIPLSILFACGITALAQHELLKFLARKFTRAFESGLPDFLTLISSGLRSGMSMPQSVAAAASDGNGPVERQVRRALAEVKVGLTIDEALMRVAQRMGSDDLRWAIAALQIQREVGGNLAKILDTASSTIRARDDLRREIATLSAEGRISAYVLVALPIGIFLFMMMGRRDYVEIFWTTGIGKLMLFGFVSAVGVGWFWMRKLVVVEV